MHMAKTTGLLTDGQIMALSARDTMDLIYYFQNTFLARGGRDATPPEKNIVLKLYAKREVSSWLRKNPTGVETAKQAQLLEEALQHTITFAELELDH